MDKETLCTIALSQIKGLGNNALLLYKKAGNASVIMDNHDDVRAVVDDCSENLAGIVRSGFTAAMERAKREAELIDTHSMRALPYNAADYPHRLRSCCDAPLLIYYTGNANLNAKHIVSMVGTRRCTPYGRDLCSDFISEIKEYVPDCLIVSGLAYGIDVCAHNNALENGLPTVGVLAHGLEKIYPYTHRPIAVKMTKNGGLLTEYITNTTIEKGNFLQRNRIVAGISDATIVVESADRGGSLVTAKIANSYGREVFAFPGRVYDETSKGCNRLIHSNMAVSTTCAEDFLKSIGWNEYIDSKVKAKQMSLFDSFTEQQQRVLGAFEDCDSTSLHEISAKTGFSSSEISSLLFDLEMQGVIAVVGALRYRLLKHNL